MDGIDTLRADLAHVTAERDALRAIVEGRTVAPTDAEIAAHWRTGGAWVVQGVTVLRLLEEATRVRDQHSHSAIVWLPMLHGRPCAWPVVEVSR